MENIPLGPAPAPAPESRGRITRAATTLLGLLEGEDRPWSLAELSEAAGLHVNTVREQLQQLLDADLADREAAPASGRGRPAWLYRATSRADQVTEYAGLATALAAALHRHSPDPTGDAVAAGTEWGHDLARRTAPPADAGDAPAGSDARRQVTTVLDRMGFDPRPDDAHRTLRLTRCPLLEAAEKHPDVICAVHLGIARGAMAEYGADDSEVDLLPFAEPGACLLHLAPRPATGENA